MEREEWLRAYADAWERADASVADLFTDDATYRSHVFRAPRTGRDGIRAYWEDATATQRDARVRIGEALVDGTRVVAEWWTTMAEEEGPVTLPGVLLLDFEGDRCRELREYWALEPGRHDPFVEWGRFEPGERAREHAERWAERYAAAWRAGDPDAAAALYSEDVVYRSHTFREPHRGRAGVREYSAQAYAAESGRDVWIGVAAAAGASAAVEYRTKFLTEDTWRTLAGCALLSFDDGGLVTSSREYWHLEEGVL
jgi:ketosteroid isomerase-like protein